MAINGINGTGSTAGADGKTAAAPGSNAMGRDDFMKLLVAQLKNQDPNNPLDTKDLVTQLSQLTSVEQLVTIGEKMGDLTTATNGMAANQSSGLIGKTVKGTADTVRLDSSGAATGSVRFSANADTASVNVINDAGRVVRTFEMTDKNAGPQTITWDGKTDSGERATGGMYRFEVAAKDKSGNPIDADQSVSGVVSGVSYENGAPELVVGTTRVPLSNISSITQ